MSTSGYGWEERDFGTVCQRLIGRAQSLIEGHAQAFGLAQCGGMIRRATGQPLSQLANGLGHGCTRRIFLQGNLLTRTELLADGGEVTHLNLHGHTLPAN